MTFIGFTAKKKDEELFKTQIEMCFSKVQLSTMVIAINEESIDNIKKIKFETLIIDRNLKGTIATKQLKEMLNISKYILINGDIVDIQKMQNMNLNVITYGFGSKCTITASSVEDNSMMVCLQRSIININKVKVEPEELWIMNVDHEKSKYINMVNSAIKLIYF